MKYSLKNTLLVGLFIGLIVPTVFAESIDPTKLELGNGKYSKEPKVGYLYSCLPDKYYSITRTGARSFGNWIHGTTWDSTARINTGGEVYWPNAKFIISTTTTSRTIFTNDLPLHNPTGVFPVAKNDPAYPYDPNPNVIKAQDFEFTVPLNPVASTTPSCVQIPVGVALDGTIFYSALDSHGRDEPAYELQDTCGGMSDPNGIYHRYRPNDCLPHIKENNALVGYGLDGFGIFSPHDENGKELITKDLDECHGTTTPIMWDGRRVNMYHYVLTRDYPYSISCYRGAPSYLKIPPPPIDPTQPFTIVQNILWKVGGSFKDLSSFLGLLAGLFLILGYFPYIYEVLKRKSIPNRASWLIWSLSTATILFGVNSTGTHEAIWVPVADAIGCFIILILSIKLGVGGWSKTDKISLSVCLLSLIVWRFTGSALIALIANLLIYTSGYIPTIKKSMGTPQQESLTAWTLFFIGVLLNLLTVIIGHDSGFAVWLYPIVLVMTVGTLYFFLIRKKLAF